MASARRRDDDSSAPLSARLQLPRQPQLHERVYLRCAVQPHGIACKGRGFQEAACDDSGIGGGSQPPGVQSVRHTRVMWRFACGWQRRILLKSQAGGTSAGESAAEKEFNQREPWNIAILTPKTMFAIQGALARSRGRLYLQPALPALWTPVLPD
jgi:hypothetical protein